jgi:hypothetical protein
LVPAHAGYWSLISRAKSQPTTITADEADNAATKPKQDKRNETMKSTKTILFIAILTFTCFTSACSKVWNAHELIIGEWDLVLKGGWLFSPHRIFPKCSSTTNGEGKHLNVHRRPWGSSLDCSLSLCPDGTFVLKPKENSSHDQESGRLEMRGHWDVLANPYCITDRFYDQLQLRSLPRATQASATVAAAADTKSQSEGAAGSVVVVDLSCRVWGRHVKSETMGRKGWMTHGTLLWKDGGWTNVTSSSLSSSPSRRVLASFSAKRTHREPSQLGFVDEKVFGY